MTKAVRNNGRHFTERDQKYTILQEGRAIASANGYLAIPISRINNCPSIQRLNHNRTSGSRSGNPPLEKARDRLRAINLVPVH